MRKLLIATAFVIVASPAGAAPCALGTLAGYLALAPGGCTVGGLSFFGFEVQPTLTPGGPSVPTPDASIVAVEPTTTGDSGLIFRLAAEALTGQVYGLAVGFTVSAQLTGAAITLDGGSATGSGVVSATQDVCFAGDLVLPGSCVGGAGSDSMNSQAIEGFYTGPDSRVFGPYSFIDVLIDIGIDGGPDGTASLSAQDGVLATFQSATPTTAVPEPATLTLLVAGLLGATLRRPRS